MISRRCANPAPLWLALGALISISANAADTTAPVLTNLALSPKLVDAACGGSLKATLNVTDDSSGFASGSIGFLSPDKKTYTAPILGPISGTAVNGVFQASFALTGLASGAWTVQQVVLNDATGNSHTYQSADLQTLKFPITFNVISAADSAAPALTAFNITPLKIDTTANAATVTFKAHVTDSTSGFGGGTVQVTSPSNKTKLIPFNVDPSAGTLNDGDFTAPIPFPAFSEPGNWVVTNVTIHDGCGNTTIAGPAGRPLPSASDTTLAVTSVQDTTAPALTAFDFTPKAVTVTSAPAVVTFSFTITDDLSGFGNINLAKCIDGFARLTSPAGTDRFLKACITKRNSGTNKNGVYEATATIPAYAEPGNWHVTEVSLQDASGNLMTYGTQLPAGLALNAASGAITGIPSSAGAFNFTAKISDASKPAAVAVKALPGVVSSGLAIITSTLPEAIQDNPYSTTITAAGGTAPYTFSWSSSSSLPPGLAINQGAITGSPTATGTYNFDVTVTDSASPARKASRSFTLPVLLVSITPANLPNGATGTAYSAQLSTVGGLAPVTWTLNGQLPNGLALDATTGAITGSPTAPGSFSFAITAADSSTPKKTATRSFNIDIGLLEITTLAIPGGSVGSNYAATLAATGGVLPYAWSPGPNLQDLKFSWELVVTDANPDRTPPNLATSAGFDFSPKAITTTSAPAAVTATLHVSDDLSGFVGGAAGNSFVEFTSPSRATISTPIAATATSGNSKDGVYQAVLTFPAFSENGTWRVSKVQLTDAIGNTNVYDAKSLAALGFPVELRNGTPAGSVSPAALDFGNQLAGVRSGAKIVVVSSTGSAPLEITALSVAGANAGDFIVSESAPLTVAESSSTSLHVAFKPAAGGPRSAVLSITYGTETKTVTLTGVGQAPNTVSIAVSPATPLFGQNVTLTANVTGSVGGATPTGTVTFSDSGTTLGTANLSSGTAIMSTSKLATGAHSIVASYSGDGNYNTSASVAFSLNIGKLATTLALSSSANPALLGQPLTITATSSQAQASGRVQFFEGAVLLGFADLDGGKAAITLNGLSLGAHSITASYAGDANNTASTAAELKQQVIRTALLAISAKASPESVVVGNQLTYTLTITNRGRTPATKVVVTDLLPPTVRLLFVQPVLPTAVCTGTSTIVCTYASLPAASSTSISIVVSTNVAGEISNAASVTAAELDPNLAQQVVTTTAVRLPNAN